MEDTSQFAGFWKRVGAYLLDAVLFGIVQGILCGILLVVFMFVLKMDKQALGGLGIVLYGFILLGHVAYFALFESSSKQATPGKMALGIVVTDARGGRISLARAIGRNFGRIISGLFFGLGYIICGFTARRQAVHDLLASTLVVNHDAPLRIKNKDEFQIMQSQ